MRQTAPAVRPNMAMLIAKKARWYPATTERIRVCTTCSISVQEVTRNTPA
jgi:anaerobic ribonucleoside-triphosphate reductase